MSRFERVTGAGWFVAGVAVAVLLIPTTVGAVAVYNGIVGTSGNKADVTASGQLLTGAAQPNRLFDINRTPVNGNIPPVVVLAPGATHAAIITNLSVDLWQAGYEQAGLYIGDSTCSNKAFFGLVREFATSQSFTYEVTFPSGLAIASGDALCAQAYAQSQLYSVYGNGYYVPASSVPPLP